ncbi:MAG: hypothetical protein ACOC1P_02265, partial [Minisyncoccales bacterium]
MNFLKEKKKFFLLIIIFLLFLTPLFLFAQDIPLEVAYPELGGEDPSAAGGEEGLTSYINYIYSFLFFVAAIILFGVLIYGGFLYLTAGANASKTKRARSFLVSGLIGVVLVFSSHLVLRTINPQITKIDLEKLNPIGEEGPVAGEPDVEKSDSKALALPVDKGIEE